MPAPGSMPGMAGGFMTAPIGFAASGFGTAPPMGGMGGLGGMRF